MPLDRVPAGVVVVTDRGEIVQVNRWLLRSMGWADQAALDAHGRAPALTRLAARFENLGLGGKVKASTVKKVEDIVDNYPTETVAVLRGWMHTET